MQNSLRNSLSNIIKAFCISAILLFPLRSGAEGSVNIIKDVPTVEAFKKFSKKLDEITAKCPEVHRKSMDLGNFFACMCDHLPEVAEAHQIKIDAFADLMMRKPELVNKTVKIEGVFGTWYLNTEDRRKNNLDYLKKRYKCK